MSFRKLEPRDVERISQISYEAFMEGYYTDVPEEELRLGTYNYVVDEIRDSTFAEVYEENGEVLGFLLGYVDGMEKGFSGPGYAHKSGEFGGFVRIGKLIGDCNKRMKNSCTEGMDCEGLLFALDKKCRRKGIGTELMDHMISDFRKHGCRCMFLFTGDNCTMDYYDDRDCYILAGKEMLDIGSRIRDSRMYLRFIK